MDVLLREEKKEERPRLFSHLVGLMKRLNPQSLQEVWNTYSNTEDYK